MIRRTLLIFNIFACCMAGLPTIAAAEESAEVVTGLTNVGPALLLIALAFALLLTLVFRT